MDVELLEWADILVIAPLSANTLAKIAGGLCDDLLTSTVRAWNPMKKLVFAAPSMSPFTWKNPLTKEQCLCIVNLGITIIQPVKRRSGAEEYETGAMAEPSDISRYISGGQCDDLLSSIARGWDYSKPFFVAPSMDPSTWRNPFTQRHCVRIKNLGISVIPPASEKLEFFASSDEEGEDKTGAMPEPSEISYTVRISNQIYWS
uniref:phosphopantothenoylcysteine decarboxylase n=1 Tax=Cajanus cajan TaxID=3821 RepID=A0A151TB83_CAJCA|nr:Phosphopantothenoylcysteine decarboxylase [Cajanus cajan]